MSVAIKAGMPGTRRDARYPRKQWVVRARVGWLGSTAVHMTDWLKIAHQTDALEPIPRKFETGIRQRRWMDGDGRRVQFGERGCTCWTVRTWRCCRRLGLKNEKKNYTNMYEYSYTRYVQRWLLCNFDVPHMIYFHKKLLLIKNN